MTEQELRALVREAIARTSAAAAGRSEDRQLRTAGPAGTGAPLTTGHSSHAMFTLAPGDPEGRCLIEPGVACNHCGYCKSYGH
jgi:hypothetical protein